MFITIIILRICEIYVVFQIAAIRIHGFQGLLLELELMKLYYHRDRGFVVASRRQYSLIPIQGLIWRSVLCFCHFSIYSSGLFICFFDSLKINHLLKMFIFYVSGLKTHEPFAESTILYTSQNRFHSRILRTSSNSSNFNLNAPKIYYTRVWILV